MGNNNLSARGRELILARMAAFSREKLNSSRVTIEPDSVEI